MDLLEAVVLGIVQGITEFLPVSSSGHLVLLEKIWQIDNGVIFLNVVLHIATLLAVIIFYRKRIWELVTHPFCKENLYLILATLPTVAIVVLFNSFFERAFCGSLLVVGFMLTAIFLVITEKVAKDYERQKFNHPPLNSKHAILLGLFQGLAVMPGLSRSGTTLCAGIVMGIEKKRAIDFSFLMSIPIIVASLVYELFSNDFCSVLAGLNVVNLCISSVFAFLFAILGIKIMLKVVEKIKYIYFAIYLVLLSAVTLIFV